MHRWVPLAWGLPGATVLLVVHVFVLVFVPVFTAPVFTAPVCTAPVFTVTGFDT